MYRYDEIQTVHLEITSRCNASCPQCPRNLQGDRVNPHLPLGELSLDDVRKILQPELLRRLRSLYLCGNYGDPMVAKDTLDVFAYAREESPSIQLQMNTNASGRDPSWWRRLAGLVDRCIFAIDGLEDTNHLYRRGTDWKKVWRAVTAFTEAGGKAEWEYIVFAHNEHQVDEARALSQSMGFLKFTAKRSDRFVARGVARDRTPVLDRSGALLYHLEAPTDPRYRNEAIVGLDAVVRARGLERYLEETPIDCKAARNASLYVTAEGLAFPCCFTGKLYPSDQPPSSNEIWQMIARLPGGKASLDARQWPLAEIVGGAFFQELVPTGWRPSEGEHSRTAICARTCGRFDVLSEQYREIAEAR